MTVIGTKTKEMLMKIFISPQTW